MITKKSTINDNFSPSAPKPKPKPAQEAPWSDTPSSVLHLTTATFESKLKERSAALVMFYAPWCGHCKKAKPTFTSAAATMSQKDPTKGFAAIDCTANEGK